MLLTNCTCTCLSVQLQNTILYNGAYTSYMIPEYLSKILGQMWEELHN